MSQWISGLNLSPVSVNNYRRIFSLLFHFGGARGYCKEDVMKHTPHMKTGTEEPGILSVAECAAILNAADERIRAALVIGLFCGVRDAELHRLDWRAVDLESEVLVIGANISKVSQRRMIPIRENVRKWLEPLRQIGGPIIRRTGEARQLIFAARRAAGIGTGEHDGIPLRPWPSNALRHSYASYRLAQWPDAAALALEMGNSPGVIIRHYRQLVKPAAAAAFWNLTPQSSVAAPVQFPVEKAS